MCGYGGEEAVVYEGKDFALAMCGSAGGYDVQLSTKTVGSALEGTGGNSRGVEILSLIRSVAWAIREWGSKMI